MTERKMDSFFNFGPEWMRNLPREGSNSGSGGQSNGSSSSGQNNAATSPGQSNGANSEAQSNGDPSTNTNTSSMRRYPLVRPPKYKMATYRYGREEMLALHDRTLGPPSDLLGIDMLYSANGQPPLALSSDTFEEERDSVRHPNYVPPPITHNAPGQGPGQADRFGGVRASGGTDRGRGRGRLQYHRVFLCPGRPPIFQPIRPGEEGPYGEGAGNATRPWAPNTNPTGRNGVENTERTPKEYTNRPYKRWVDNSNWRRQAGRGGEVYQEWRPPSDGTRTRSVPQHDKWGEREWSDRGDRERNPSWGSNRRAWAGESQNSDDLLPEWATDNNAVPTGGTFDSSGAFHGVSNDDSTVSRSIEHPAHGRFNRTTSLEPTTSEEWWASEKAKKLTGKKLDTADTKFKKLVPLVAQGGGNRTKPNLTKEDTTSDHNASDIDSFKQSDMQQHSHTSDNNALPTWSSYDPPGPSYGMSSDDSAIPSQTEEKFHALARSHTHGSFIRVKALEPGVVEEWWANQKVKRMPEKKSEQSIPNFLRGPPEEVVPNNPGVNINRISKEDKATYSLPGTSNLPDNQEQPISIEKEPSSTHNVECSSTDTSKTANDNLKCTKKVSFNPDVSERKTFDAFMRSDINVEEANDEIGNFQSVLLKNNNGLRQQHQNMVAVAEVPQIPQPKTSVSPPAEYRSILKTVKPEVAPYSSMLRESILLKALYEQRTSMEAAERQHKETGISSASSATLLENKSPVPVPTPEIQAPRASPGQSNIYLNQGNPAAPAPNAVPDFSSAVQEGVSRLNNFKGLPNHHSWYYEDPQGHTQGPFSAKEMYDWYRLGFFPPALMVRRSFETRMRPLTALGKVPPFVVEYMNNLKPHPTPTLPQQNHVPPQQATVTERLAFPPPQIPRSPIDSMLGVPQNYQPDVMHSRDPTLNPLGYTGVANNYMINQPLGPQMPDSLWSQQGPNYTWMQSQYNPGVPTTRPPAFWACQPQSIHSGAVMPEVNLKEMKTEDQILEECGIITAFTTMPTTSSETTLPNITTYTTPNLGPSLNDNATPITRMTPNIEELEKFMLKDPFVNKMEPRPKSESPQFTKEPSKIQSVAEANNIIKKTLPTSPNKTQGEIKTSKTLKTDDNENSNKFKENISTKGKSKSKPKEEKKEEIGDYIEESAKTEKKEEVAISVKTKKEEKFNKKELEKEKKEWAKEGFTLVKSSEKSSNKENKRKTEEAKLLEEAERKRREDEKLQDEESLKKITEVHKKVQAEEQLPNTRKQSSQASSKKAPWSAIASQTTEASNKDGPTLAEIQRLEREKKIEQIKEQQQMFQMIAQQQQEAIAREQEMQASSAICWAPQKGQSHLFGPIYSLADIHAEQARAQALLNAQERTPTPPVTPVTPVPWASTHNGAVGGFWDTETLAQTLPKPGEKPQESTKSLEVVKTKKKPTVNRVSEVLSPANEFNAWCSNVLSPWSAKIDVPTFIGFLKDIESPYEVKDYVKCYLGETKESSDFSHQFLEKRSKLLRTGTTTPVDDLCVPARAVNPGSAAGMDFLEGKGKKVKKNKMLKVDARILGFSVTASEDRINVGDIDTA